MLMDQYADKLMEVIRDIRDSQRENILAGARLAADTICNDGILYVFGCGHSHILSEEVFYRAGGLACVSPIVYEPLMLHESATGSGKLEKTQDLAEKVLAGYEFGPHDLLFVISTSGVNPVPVEVAVEAKRQGVKVVGISSGAYAEVAPRNKHGLHLSEAVDLAIDNRVPYGDACLEPEGLGQKMTPVSTVGGTFLLHSIFSEAVQLCLEAGCKPPVFISANIPGTGEHNQVLFDRYMPRIKCM